ncbi:hypothetical protein Drorol1_Dr00022942 [Drosera rotundifolia]
MLACYIPFLWVFPLLSDGFSGMISGSTPAIFTLILRLSLSLSIDRSIDISILHFVGKCSERGLESIYLHMVTHLFGCCTASSSNQIIFIFTLMLWIYFSRTISYGFVIILRDSNPSTRSSLSCFNGARSPCILEMNLLCFCTDFKVFYSRFYLC